MFTQKIDLRFGLVILTSILLTACADNTLPKPSQLESIRVLALTTPVAEFSLGDTVVVTPWISDLSATASSTFSYRWRACWDPGVGFGAQATCSSANWTTVAVSGLDYATKAWTGDVNTFSVNIPSSAAEFSLQSSNAQFNGIAYVVEFELIRNDGASAKAFRRLLVSTNPTKNANPSAPDALLNGASLSGALPLTEVSLTGSVNTSSVQTYSYYADSGELKSRNETLILSWYTSDGSFTPGVSDINGTVKFKGPAAAPTGRTAAIVLIVRDDRGGIAAVVRRF